MPYDPMIKDTILIPSGTSQNPTKLHLFAIITPRCQWGHHLLVSFASVPPAPRYHDASCPVAAGEHPFIKVRSFIHYGHARIVDAAHLTNCVDRKSFIIRDPISDGLLLRIVAGLGASPHVAPRIWNYFNGGQP
jgi:hypothetical protein